MKFKSLILAIGLVVTFNSFGKIGSVFYQESTQFTEDSQSGDEWDDFLSQFDSDEKEKPDFQKWKINKDIDNIEQYCRQNLFFTYGVDEGYVDPVRGIDNESVDEIIEILHFGADDLQDSNCQFMLGCVLSGNQVLRDWDENKIPTPADYKYLNDTEARKYFKLFLDNPKRNSEYTPFGYSDTVILRLIKNAYPDLK